MFYFRLGLLMILLGMALTLTAQEQRDDASTHIRYFSTTFAEVGSDALNQRTARVPITWRVDARSLVANLYFEQVLPDGTVVNIELPRATRFVASQGTGVVAPILPDNHDGEIVLRLTVRNIITGRVYDTDTIRMPIVPGLAGADDTALADVPAILYFTRTADAPIPRMGLELNSVRLTVSWGVDNRPPDANLAFEQVLPDGTIENVELPRPVAWVNSTGEGVIVPMLPSATADELVLRLRLFNTATDQDLDVQYLRIPIADNADPRVVRFDAAQETITRADLQSGTVIEVAWELINRPRGSEIVFAQVLADGTTRDARLPSAQPAIVPSRGIGVVRLVSPAPDADVVTLQLRLLQPNTGITLAERILTIPITSE
jgi:hypothetical protein